MMIAELPVNTDTISDRRQLIEQLYKNAFPTVARFVHAKGGSADDAKDVFHDALIVFYEKHAAGKIPHHVHATAYLTGIARHLWFRKFNAESMQVTLGEDETIDLITDVEQPVKEYHNILKLLEQTGKKCMELLRAFYYDRQNMEHIKKRFGYGSVRSATVQKYKCLEKIREEVKERNAFYEDFA